MVKKTEWEVMKCFVTGGAGFIGSHIVDRLIQLNNEVTVFDNLSSGKMDFIKHHFGNERFKFIKGDLLDKKSLEAAMVGQEFVYHLAANPDVRQGFVQPGVDLQQGIVATYNVLETMRKKGVRKIVFSSSSVVYGEAKYVPTPENYGPLIPISMYGAAKLACEALITAFAHNFDMQCWLFRIANVVGERGTHGVIVDFIEKLKKNPTELEILGDGTQKKSYLLVEECVDALLYAVENSSAQVNIYNIGSEDQIEVCRIAEILVEELHLKNVKFKYTGGERGWRGDVPAFLLSTEKINRLGWKAKHTSEQAVRKAIKIAIKERWLI